MSEAFQDFGYTFSKEKVFKIEIKGIFEYFWGLFRRRNRRVARFNLKVRVSDITFFVLLNVKYK